jgi:pyruvate-ferredoxin/flavodoxin oxidoreductase
MKPAYATLDGNEAAALVAYKLNELCAIYPITPSSPMAELADQWSAEGRTNLWGTVPSVVEMQSEAGAAGTVHGALQTGALTTTFTASQGLLLMVPNMFKIAGELTPAVFHVAARAVATHALSIFGDHSDVMSVRSTGFAMLASSSVQEAHDLAAIAQAATLRARVPFVHFFDGFRTSHEVQKIALLSDDDLRALVDEELVLRHRGRALSPEQPVVRGTAQNPDVFFQSREAANRFYSALPDIVTEVMEAFAQRTGRRYRLFDYFGDPRAERVVVIMGSGAETFREAADAVGGVGVLQVHLYRPFDTARLLAVLPPAVKTIAVLDRTKEPGALGEPLYMDIVTALAEAGRQARVIGGRYGLGSKELTPAMAKAVFDELAKPEPKNHFTIGIEDDVGGTSLPYDRGFITESPRVVRAVFFGLGSDGTVGANKNTIKIIGEKEGISAQGYFVYDSKKSGSQTVSHLRFGPVPIRSTYLIERASFIGCHQWSLLDRVDVLGRAERGATLLLDAPYPPDAVWDALPSHVKERIRELDIAIYAIDARDVARRAGLGSRTNTVMQTCFFAISRVLPREEALQKIRGAIEKTYARKGTEVVRKNFEAVDITLANLHRIEVPTAPIPRQRRLPLVPHQAPAFVRDVTARMMEGRGDEIPVGALPIDGTYPTGTTRWEKRNVSTTAPIWEPDVCIQCGNCAFVCPHSVIRAKFYGAERLAGAPPSWKSAPIDARGFPQVRYTLEIYAEDCTGCGLCVEACPATDRKDASRRAINMAAKGSLDERRANIAFFEALPYPDRSRVDFSTVRGAQYLEPLFEFPGACEGCGETPYLKLISQLFGDRMVVANATGCSSIYGGNLPTTPWTTNAEGRGPAWANSLFEDNAEFGLGFRLAADTHLGIARALATELAPQVGKELVDAILSAPQRREAELRAQRERVHELVRRLATVCDPRAATLRSVAHHLLRRSVWIVGGDGWAYDIGSGGLDHVLASGRDVNVLVLDTEVYSNTGGQASKATPLGAVAKFSAAGKATGKKDLALQAVSYGNVYVARVAFGANPQQTLHAMREAEAYPGPSLVIAYSHCIAHGIDMQKGLRQQELAVSSGYWPLMRYNPGARASGENPFALDSGPPRTRFRDYAYAELRYRMLVHTHPARAEELLQRAEDAIKQRYATYAEMASRGMGWT